jgi:DNA modification methylase
MSKYAKIFGIISQINQAGGKVTYQELVKDFTSGRTTSLSSLSFSEFQEFERQLAAMSRTKYQGNTNKYASDPLDATRKAIISQFRSISRSANDAIAWAEKYGVNGQKKGFNEYTGQELFILLQNAKKVKEGFMKSAVKKL